MTVRNFYVEADIDGRKTTLKGGPRSKDGGMSVTLYQRNDGDIAKVLRIDCHAAQDGVLTTRLRLDTFGLPSSFTTRTHR